MAPYTLLLPLIDMIERSQHPIYRHLETQAKLPLFIIRHMYGGDAARTVLEVWAAFGMNPKNEQGLIDQLDAQVEAALIDGIPTVTYKAGERTRPLLTPAPRYGNRAYAPTFFVHINHHARELSIKRTLLVDAVVEGATRLHTAHGHPQERNATLYHLFEANQLLARKRKLIDW